MKPKSGSTPKPRPEPLSIPFEDDADPETFSRTLDESFRSPIAPLLSAKVTLTNGPQEKIVHIKDRLILGRAGELALPDSRVSRQHAHIVKQDNQFVIEDLDSSNGTLLNQKKIDGLSVLTSGDTIQIGPFVLVFELMTPVPVASKREPSVRIVAPRPPAASASTPPDRVKLEFADDTSSSLDAFPFTEDQPILEEGDDHAPVEPFGQPSESLPAQRTGSTDVTLKLAETDKRRRLPRIRFRRERELFSLPLDKEIPLRSLIRLDHRSLVEYAGTIRRDNNDIYWIEPATKSEGLLLNGKVVRSPIKLQDGDRIHIGCMEMEFTHGDA